MKNSWIILGATSGIARALIRRLAEQGHTLFLAGRNMPELEAIAADCRLRGAPAAEIMRFDARDHSNYAELIAQLEAQDGILNCAVFTGSMPEQDVVDANPQMIEGVMADSYTGPATFLSLLAPLMEARGSGAIAGIGSVAGDRGRLGNYVYGASKAAFATYLSGLRNRLGRSGVHVMTVKPGPVDTPMTRGMELPLMTTPDAVADDILQGLARKRNVLYTRKIWQLVMGIIRIIPEPIFKKMSI
ncbi:short-chain dehydrogenase [Thioclava dalianensis]|uniref:Short-chain dehydrogenase n=1 Tax=Thioclava dalianensis TaxID=1185766 RepID=A0A074U314_9RHOB|nr:SDR family oxidoreductase [Thioclava dalianensis]KEP69057.1 short-chain dehydrogenase [Thioclava dalianensis]SFM89604.1 Short-chain dehydrogenase [Thioclava dalianensis]